MDRIGGISIIGGGKEVTTGGEIGKEDRVGKSEVLGDGVCSGYQRMACSVERRQEVHLGVATLEGRVTGDEGQEDRVMVEIREGELMCLTSIPLCGRGG